MTVNKTQGKRQIEMCEERLQVSRNVKAKALAQTPSQKGESQRPPGKQTRFPPSQVVGKIQQKPVTPLDLARPSAEPRMLSQSTVHPWQEREISHVETRWKGRKHKYVITQRSCTHHELQSHICPKLQAALTCLYTVEEQYYATPEQWAITPSSIEKLAISQTSFRRPPVRMPSHAVPEPSKPSSAAKHTYLGGHAVFESKIVSPRLRILVTPNQQGALEQSMSVYLCASLRIWLSEF